MRQEITPRLEMNLDAVVTAYRRLAAALPGVALHYAMKCNGFPPVLTRLKQLGSRFEVASTSELAELVPIGVDAADMLFSNPVKAPKQIAQAYAAGVRQFAFDSLAELDKLAALAPDAAAVVRLAAPDIDSDVPSEGKFGVDAEAAVALLLAARERGLHPHGIAFHVGSQMMGRPPGRRR